MENFPEQQIVKWTSPLGCFTCERFTCWAAGKVCSKILFKGEDWQSNVFLLELTNLSHHYAHIRWTISKVLISTVYLINHIHLVQFPSSVHNYTDWFHIISEKSLKEFKVVVNLIHSDKKELPTYLSLVSVNCDRAIMSTPTFCDLDCSGLSDGEGARKRRSWERRNLSSLSFSFPLALLVLLHPV